MLLEDSIAIMSVIGAVLFFGAGVLLGWLVKNRSSEIAFQKKRLDLLTSINHTEELNAVMIGDKAEFPGSTALSARRTDLETLHRKYAALKEALEREMAQNKVQAEVVFQQKALLLENEVAIAQYTQTITELEAAKIEGEKTDHELAKLKQEHASLSDSLASLKKENEAVRNEKDALTTEKSHLSKKNEKESSNTNDKPGNNSDLLRDKVRECLSRIESLEYEKQEYVVKNELLQKEISKLQQNAETSQALKQQERGAGYKQNVNRLDLDSKIISISDKALGRPPQIRNTWNEAGITKCLERILDQIAAFKNYRSAVFADMLGFTVAGKGGSVDGLSSAAGLFNPVDERLRETLSLSVIKKMIIIDENNLACTLFPLTVLDNPLVLATLTVGPGPSNQKIGQYLTDALAQTKTA